MLERDNSRRYEAPPVRDRLPTIPHDLSEYARAQTGPAVDVYDDPRRAMSSGPLVDIWPTDVPCVTGTAADYAGCVEPREAIVLSLLNGESSLASMLEAVDLPGAEILSIVCDLCARGIVTLDRSQRSSMLLG